MTNKWMPNAAFCLEESLQNFCLLTAKGKVLF